MCRWLYAVADDFFTKQLPHNVTWGLTVLYALDAPGDFSDTRIQASPAQGAVPLRAASSSLAAFAACGCASVGRYDVAKGRLFMAAVTAVCAGSPHVLMYGVRLRSFVGRDRLAPCMPAVSQAAVQV